MLNESNAPPTTAAARAFCLLEDFVDVDVVQLCVPWCSESYLGFLILLVFGQNARLSCQFVWCT